MDIPWVIVAAVIGVSATVAIAWINQNTLNQRELLREEIHTRETLYGEFISECARLFVDSLQHTLERPESLLRAYALINCIRLCASHEVLAAGDRLLRRISDQYFSSNLSALELFQLARSPEADPLKEFGEACRGELQAICGAIATRRLEPRFRPLAPRSERSPISDRSPTLP